MKPPLSPILFVLLIFSTLYLPSSFAQDYTQWGLPEGAKARIGKGRISDIQYSPDGTLLAVAGSVGIWLYDAETYQELALLTRDTEDVRDISFSPDNATLVSTERFGSLVLWDVVTRKLKKVITTDGSRYSAVLFSPDGKMIVTTDFKTVHLWDARTGESKRALTGHTDWVSSLSFSPDGSTLASGSDDKTIRLWDVTTGAHKKTLIGHTKSVSNIAFGRDGGTLVSVANKTVHFWDITTAELKKVLAERGTIRGGGTIQSMLFSADGGTFANVSHNRTIYVWDTATGSIKRTLTNAFEMNEQVSREVVNVSFSLNEKTFVIWRSGGLIRLWDADTGEYKSLAKDAGYVTRVVLSPDGRTLATGNLDETIHLWNASTGEHKKTIENQRFVIGRPNYVIKSGRDAKGMALSHKGDKLAAGIGYRTTYLWDAITRQQQPLVGNINESESSLFSGVLFSPDGNTLASWSFPTYKGIHLWDVATGGHKRTLTGQHTSVLTSVSFSLNGGTLATGSRDKTVCLWDVATGTQKKTLKMHTREVEAVLFSPNGETLVSGDIAGTIQLWETATGKHKQTLKRHTSGVSSIAFTRDGHTLAVGSVDGTIYLWDTGTGQYKQTFIGHADAITSIVFNSDGLNFASTSEDGTVRLWDTDTGNQKKIIAAYKGTGWRVSFYTDGWMLASREDDNTHGNSYWPQSKNVELWNLATAQRLKILKGHTNNVVSVLFSTDGQTLASAGDDGIVLLWDLTSILNMASEAQ